MYVGIDDHYSGDDSFVSCMLLQKGVLRLGEFCVRVSVREVLSKGLMYLLSNLMKIRVQCLLLLHDF